MLTLLGDTQVSQGCALGLVLLLHPSPSPAREKGPPRLIPASWWGAAQKMPLPQAYPGLAGGCFPGDRQGFIASQPSAHAVSCLGALWDVPGPRTGSSLTQTLPGSFQGRRKGEEMG